MSVPGSVPTSFRLKLAPILERDRYLLGILDHMIIGHDIAVGGVHDHARSGALLRARRLIGSIEKPAKKRIAE